jgi:hypothetical protein
MRVARRSTRPRKICHRTCGGSRAKARGSATSPACPLVPLKAAAGAFGDPQHIEDDGFEWVAVESRHRLRPGMFVAQVVGKSMEPAIPDGAWCLFRAPVEGTRQGKTVLVQLRDATDPETGQRYTVKRYESEKANTWREGRLLASLRAYVAATLEGRWEMPDEELAAVEIQAAWGPRYDVEQMLEHAIVHVLRHRRQIERFLAGLPGASPSHASIG